MFSFLSIIFFFFFFNDTATTEIYTAQYTLSLHDALPISLDEENIGRFTAVLRELAEEAQFIVVTHNKHTMAVADSLFGVTMEEPGVSKLVSVRLADLQPA